jgi:rare lipoprotein A
MNQNLCRSFTAAVLLSTIGISLSAHAEQIPQTVSATATENIDLATEPIAESIEASVNSTSSATRVEAGTLELANEPAVAESENASATPDQQSALLEPESADLSDLFTVTAHTLDQNRIAVLRIDSLPVFKFVERSPEVTAGTKENAPQTLNESSDPVIRAEQVALQIDQFYQASGDPESIHVRWDEDLEEYVISLNGESLVLINEATYYANTTGEHAQDALHATNRLRTLLGGAAPLTEVEGQPEPQVVAARSNWNVTSMFTGQASWYGPGFHGRHTASGEVFNQNALTAAHRTLPFGTQVRVTNVHTGRQVVVRINDRGPFSHGRVIDLSAGAARAIGLDRAGVGPVQVEVLTN